MIDGTAPYALSYLIQFFQWSPIREVFTIGPIFRRMLLGTSLFIWQNGTGINAINYYSPTIFKSIGITGTNTGLFTTGIFGVIKTTFTLIWIFFLIDREFSQFSVFGLLNSTSFDRCWPTEFDDYRSRRRRIGYVLYWSLY